MSSLVHNELAPASDASGRSVWSSALQLAVLATLIFWLYTPVLVRLVMQWGNDPTFSYGFLVPLFSAFLVWQDRARFAKMPFRPSWAGLPFIAFALSILILGQLGAELFLARFSLLPLLAGLIVLFLGWDFFRAVLFPCSFLVLMIPIPTILFNQITFPLQLIASRIASSALAFLGVPVLREGNILTLASMELEVAKACSGIRFLIALITLAIVYGFLAEKRLWARLLLALASVPIAVTANSIRIIGVGLLVQHRHPEMAEGFSHDSWGWFIFVLSLFMLYALHALIRGFGQRRVTS